MSITRRMKKLAVQRDQYINPWDGLVHSRAEINTGMRRMVYTPAEIKADRLYAARMEREDREVYRQARKTLRPVYGKSVRKGAARECYWIDRRTPDRSIRHAAAPSA